MEDLRNIVFRNHSGYLFHASGDFEGFLHEMRGQILWYLKNEYDFDAVESPRDTLRVFYNKGKSFETLERLKKIFPVEILKTYTDFIEITI